MFDGDEMAGKQLQAASGAAPDHGLPESNENDAFLQQVAAASKVPSVVVPTVQWLVIKLLHAGT